MNKERHWMYNLADLISGRIYHSLVSLNHRQKELENKMTENERRINAAAQKLTEEGKNIQAGIDALKAKIDDLGVREDLADELTALENAVANVSSIGDALTPATPENTSTGGTPAPDVVGGPLDHGMNVPTPLAGGSGATDAGAPTSVPQPGVPVEDAPTTPLAENATSEANPEIVEGSADSEANPAPEATPVPADTAPSEDPAPPATTPATTPPGEGDEGSTTWE